MVKEWLSQKCFSAVHGSHLIYNTCWEDPRLDRKALELTEADRVVVITSAGCNALDYAICGPESIDAVDVNPLQNALLELKIAAIKSLDHDQFFHLFGYGWHPEWRELYFDQVRSQLNPDYQEMWDNRIGFFSAGNRRQSFYFRGTSGFFAWMVNYYLDQAGGLRDDVLGLLECQSVAEQQEHYESCEIRKRLWRKPIRWLLQRDMTMAMLGVPRSQRKQIDKTYAGGISQFVQDRIESVFTRLPLGDNYFWRVYITGEYTEACCPEYLTLSGFNRLKSGRVDMIKTHTTTIEQFLEGQDRLFSRFVLLDHMDWLYEHARGSLANEWSQIFRCSTPSTRVLWRTAAMDCDFVNSVNFVQANEKRTVGEHLDYHHDLAATLHQRDRVNTYGGFFIADCKGVAV